MMPRLSHEGHSSKPDKYGNSYEYSIDPSTKRKGSNGVAIYNARAFCFRNHHAKYHNEIVRAKFLETGGSVSDSKQWAKKRVDNVLNCQLLAGKFNNFIANTCRASENNNVGGVKFLLPTLARLQEVSFTRKRRQRGEYFVVERKPSTRFTTTDGHVHEDCLPKKNARRKSLKSRTSRTNSRDAETEDQNCNTLQDVDNDILSIYVNETVQPVVPSCPVQATAPIPVQFGQSYDNRDATDGCTPPSYEESEAIENFRKMSLMSSNGNNLSDIDRLWQQMTPPAYTQSPDGADQSNPDYDSQRGRSMSTYSSSGSLEDDQDVPHPILHAFTHFYFCHSSGKMAISNMKGSKREGGYVLTTPTIHSLDQSCGSNDKGLDGVQKVVANHKCNRFCENLTDMNQTLLTALKTSV